jgi:NhaP-type Na+/H+ or K+/H+ antiporter
VVERSPLSFAILFLGLGVALSPRGVDLIAIEPEDRTLEAVATVTLALVLFLDATKLHVEEMGARWLIPALILGPGTAIVIALGAVPLALVLGFPWTVAFMGGAILASTDPVVLREVLRDERIPRSVRQILQVEAGMNDLVVLPVLLVLIAVAGDKAGSVGGWAAFGVQTLLLGPLIGFVVGGGGAWLMARVDERLPVRDEHQALYGVGLVLAAYALATAVGGDGFLSAFFAGLAVVLLNQTMCSCFLDFGETAAEMAMMLAFVLFGVVLADVLEQVSLVEVAVLAALVIFAIRPAVLTLVLARAHLSWPARFFVGWFGPRGLNSLLLALLVVHAEVEGATELLAAVGAVVLTSTLVHGASAQPLAMWYGRRAAAETLTEERESTAAGLFAGEGGHDLLAPAQLAELLASAEPPIVLDVRSRSTYARDGGRIPGSVRVLPGRLVVAYCT